MDETRLLRLHFPSDLSPRQPGLIAGVLFGEAGRSKSEDCRFSAKESCYDPCLLVRFSIDATACCSSTTASTCFSSAGFDSLGCWAPASGVSGLDMGLRPPEVRAISHWWRLWSGWRIHFLRCSGIFWCTKERAEGSRFGDSAATSISGGCRFDFGSYRRGYGRRSLRYGFGCGCARYGILSLKWQCTYDGPTKWDVGLYVYAFQMSSGRMRMHENGPADCLGLCCYLEGGRVSCPTCQAWEAGVRDLRQKWTACRRELGIYLHLRGGSFGVFEKEKFFKDPVVL